MCDPGLDLPFTVDEGEVTTVTAQINGAQVSVRRSCVKCYAWQADFDAKVNFHRCMRCGLLQKIASFQPSVTAKISVSGDFEEDDFKLSNSVLKNHLEDQEDDFKLSNSVFKNRLEDKGLVNLDEQNVMPNA